MAGKIKSFFRLWALYARMDLNWVLQDTGSTLLVMLSELVTNVAAVAGVLLLAVRFGGAGGLTSDEVLLMLGFFQLANGFCCMMFGGYNIMNISRRVGRGQLDHMLIQPRPLPVQMLTEGFLPFSGSSGLLLGIALTVIACVRLRLPATPAFFLQLALYTLLHTALIMAQSYLFGALAFYKPVACEEISSVVIDLNVQLGKFPLFGIPKALQIMLCTALPVGLLAYLPALGLLHKVGGAAAYALPPAVAIAFVTAAAAAFRGGLKHYMKNSCTRYRDMGHRS